MFRWVDICRGAIEGLRTRVKELEELLSERAPKDTDSSSLCPAASHASSASMSPGQGSQETERNWEEALSTDARTVRTLYYGPSSSLHFVGRVARYLGQALHQPYCESQLQPNTASSTFPCLTGTLNRSESDHEDEGYARDQDLSRAQEEYFINLFWQSYHCTVPILAEADFREHYESLWVDLAPNRPRNRRSSALVDIVLGICMQYGTGFWNPYEENKSLKTDVDGDDASIAGRFFYSRCQKLLSYNLEAPSIANLQCHIFSVIYLCNASFFNMAHTTLAVAVCTAHMLGIHHEPQSGIARAEQSIRKRVWWTLYLMDSYLSIALGRPYLAQASKDMCTLPGDDQEQAMLTGTQLNSNVEGISWLSFHVQSVKLTLAVRAVHSAFQEKCLELIDFNNGEDIYDDRRTLDILASSLGEKMSMVHDWAHNVPTGLKNFRKGTGDPFSTQRPALDIDLYIPLWVQRQRIILELLYHDLAMRLLRPFIRFPPIATSPTPPSPLSDSHSIACLNHAIAITLIIYQGLSETDILNGWHQAYQFQWDATLCILGFVLGNPVCPATPSARKAIQTAIAVLDIFGSNFASAASAATITRNVSAQANQLVVRFRNSLTAPSPVPSKQPHKAAPQRQRQQQQQNPPQSSGRVQEQHIDYLPPATVQALPTPPFASTFPVPPLLQHVDLYSTSAYPSPDTVFVPEEQFAQSSSMSFDPYPYFTPEPGIRQS